MKKSFSTRIDGYSSTSISLAVISIVCGGIAGTRTMAAFVVFFFIGLFLLSNYKGVMVDMKRNQVKEFQSLFWFRSGKWRSLKDFNLVLLSFGTRYVPRYGHVGTYKIFLVSPDKDKYPSIVLQNVSSQREAVALAEEFSKKLGLPFKNNL